jgi:alpha-L-arabinofuranosidase
MKNTVFISFVSSPKTKQHMQISCRADQEDFAEWTKVEFDLQSSERNANSRLQITTSKSGVIWFDQVSLMPSDTYMVIYFRIPFYPFDEV